MTTKSYHTEEEKAREAERASLSHGLRVAPAIVGSLWDAGCDVISVNLNRTMQWNYIQVYAKEKFVEWLRGRGVEIKVNNTVNSQMIQVSGVVDGMLILDFLTPEQCREVGLIE